MIDAALSAFVTLFVIIDPIGLTPLFVALTTGMSPAARNKVALRACILAAAILALFGIAGEAMLAGIGIGLPAFRIAGGILLFLIAVEMLFDKRTQRREKSVDAQTHDPTPHDPSVFPLAVPLLAGPGALATMILLMGAQSGDLPAQAVLMGVMVLVVLVAYMLFRLGNLLDRVMGPVGINVVTRLLGMLLAALAVQFVLDGLSNLGLLPGGAQ